MTKTRTNPVRILALLMSLGIAGCNAEGVATCTVTTSGKQICPSGTATGSGGTGGDGTGTGGGGGGAGTASGTCNTIAFNSACLEYSNEPTAQLATYESGCSVGTWSSGLNCPAPTVAGNCAYASDPDKIQVYYTASSTTEPSGFTSGSAQTYCQAQPGGLFIP